MLDAGTLPLFYQIAALLVLAASVGLVGVALRQPLIVSYIAVGTHGRSGIAKYLLESVAEELLRRSGRDILAVPARHR